MQQLESQRDNVWLTDTTPGIEIKSLLSGTDSLVIKINEELLKLKTEVVGCSLHKINIPALFSGKTRLVLIWIPIGLESGASFVNQSQSVVMQNQSKCEITCDTQLKTALNQILNQLHKK